MSGHRSPQDGDRRAHHADGYLELLQAVLPLLQALTWSFTRLVRLVVWLERLFDRIGVVEKYLEAIVLTIVALSELLDDLAGLCEESPPASGLVTSPLNDDLSE